MEKQLPISFTVENTEKEEKEKLKADITFGLTCEMTYSQFCEMKATNPNWKGNK